MPYAVPHPAFQDHLLDREAHRAILRPLSALDAPLRLRHKAQRGPAEKVANLPLGRVALLAAPGDGRPKAAQHHKQDAHAHDEELGQRTPIRQRRPQRVLRPQKESDQGIVFGGIQ